MSPVTVHAYERRPASTGHAARDKCHGTSGTSSSGAVAPHRTQCRHGPKAEQSGVPVAMTVLAHIAGVPVEETVALLAPIALSAGAGCLAALRHRLRPRSRGTPRPR